MSSMALKGSTSAFPLLSRAAFCGKDGRDAASDRKGAGTRAGLSIHRVFAGVRAMSPAWKTSMPFLALAPRLTEFFGGKVSFFISATTTAGHSRPLAAWMVMSTTSGSLAAPIEPLDCSTASAEESSQERKPGSVGSCPCIRSALYVPTAATRLCTAARPLLLVPDTSTPGADEPSAATAASSCATARSASRSRAETAARTAASTPNGRHDSTVRTACETVLSARLADADGCPSRLRANFFSAVSRFPRRRTSLTLTRGSAGRSPRCCWTALCCFALRCASSASLPLSPRCGANPASTSSLYCAASFSSSTKRATASRSAACRW